MSETSSSAVRLVNRILYTSAGVAVVAAAGTAAYLKETTPTVDSSLREVQKDTLAAHGDLEAAYKDSGNGVVNGNAMERALAEIRDAVRANRTIQVQANPAKPSDMEAVAFASNNITTVVNQLPSEAAPGSEISGVKAMAIAAVDKNNEINSKAPPVKVERLPFNVANRF